MQRHADGCGDLWIKQTGSGIAGGGGGGGSILSGSQCVLYSSSSGAEKKKPAKPSDWVVIPVFADIVRLAISARDDCLIKYINVAIDVFS